MIGMSDSTRDPDELAAGIAAAIGVHARARILYALLGGHAKTSTELAVAADVTPSTASIHLALLRRRGLVKHVAEGKHRWYELAGSDVARLLETISVIAGTRRRRADVPQPLRAARSCYDHLAGRLGVAVHDRLKTLRWLRHGASADGYDVTPAGLTGFESLGIDVEQARDEQRRFAYGCIDWSERRPHLGGSLGAALLHLALERRWVRRDVDSRALELTTTGRIALRSTFGLSPAEISKVDRA